jgi:hypothetical protein
MKLKRWVYVIAIGIAVFQAVPVKAATDISNCPSGEIVGQPPMAQVPTYDYDAVGILQFHFHFTSESWNYNTLKVGYYDQGCVFVSEQNTGQVGGVALPPAKNLLVKVETSVPGKYNFKVYNEDTGEFQGGGLGFVPNDFNQWGISITLSNVTGSYYQPTVDVVTTPAVPLQKPVQVPAKNPVLVVPGVMGTELLKDSALLWPNINRMLTDVGDHFLDDLALDQEFQPQTGISVGDLVKEPFPGEHYYDNLLSGLERMGYKENQNLFVFPYDWRFGVSEQTATALAERIKGIAGNFKIDVIAHSTGGLLLKKALQQTQGSFIDKAILIAVPNYGSSQAGKILTGGDDLGIPWLDPLEIKKLSQNFPVIYDLLPGAVLSEEPSENSNAKAWQNARDLHTHEFDNYDWSSRGVNSFVIAGCGSDTNGQTGDGTVELTSAVGNSTPDKTFYVMGSNHSKLPGAESSLEVIGDILDNQQTQNFTNPNITQELSKCGTGQASSLFAGIARPLVEESTQGIVQVAAGSGWVYGLPPAQPVETKRELIRTVLPHLENTLVQQGNTIYLIESSQRRGFKNLADFFSYGLSLSSVVTANIADLSLPEGLLMSAKPGILARDYWDGKLYYLNQTLEKQLISTKRAIKRWTASFPQVPTLDLSGYFLGKSITK